jgi:mRNA-degrading endonuclease RelE of RelBE toxin-antitoxin system
MEMPQLRRHDGPHHFQEPPKESGDPRGPDRCRRLSKDAVGLESWSRMYDQGRESISDIDISLQKSLVKAPDPLICFRIAGTIESHLTRAPHQYGTPLRKTLRSRWKLRVGDYRVVHKIKRGRGVGPRNSTSQDGV